MKNNAFAFNQTMDNSLLYINPFKFRMPVPVNIVVDKFMNIIQVILERKVGRSMHTDFLHAFVGDYLCNLHRKAP